jgi:hypothetical protein
MKIAELFASEQMTNALVRGNSSAPGDFGDGLGRPHSRRLARSTAPSDILALCTLPKNIVGDIGSAPAEQT